MAKKVKEYNWFCKILFALSKDLQNLVWKIRVVKYKNKSGFLNTFSTQEWKAANYVCDYVHF